MTKKTGITPVGALFAAGCIFLLLALVLSHTVQDVFPTFSDPDEPVEGPENNEKTAEASVLPVQDSSGAKDALKIEPEQKAFHFDGDPDPAPTAGASNGPPASWTIWQDHPPAATFYYAVTDGRIVGPYEPQPVSDGGISFLPHLGIDFSAEKGDPVYAPADGRIISVWRDGVMMETETGETRQILMTGFGAISVRPPEPVQRGQQIGLAGESVCGGIHVEIFSDGLPVDPTPLFGGLPSS